MQTKVPADLVIVMLGTNDVKGFFGMTPLMIAKGVGRIVDHILKGGYGPHGNAPEVMIIAPANLHENIANSWPGEEFGPDAIHKASLLADQYRKIADEYGVHFLDAGCIVADPADGVHINEKGHAVLGRMVAEKVREIFS
ncbi:MAG: hydrolase, partial [Clostridia bacterium]|nr:hydrolase [Clostridia bacterium]